MRHHGMIIEFHNQREGGAEPVSLHIPSEDVEMIHNLLAEGLAATEGEKESAPRRTMVAISVLLPALEEMAIGPEIFSGDIREKAAYLLIVDFISGMVTDWRERDAWSLRRFIKRNGISL